METSPVPKHPVLTMDALDLSAIVAEKSYFGFSTATGATTQELHCVLSWNMTVEMIGRRTEGWGKGITTGVVAAVVLVCRRETLSPLKPPQFSMEHLHFRQIFSLATGALGGS